MLSTLKALAETIGKPLSVVKDRVAQLQEVRQRRELLALPYVLSNGEMIIGWARAVARR